MRRSFAAVAVLGTAAAVFSLAGCGSSSTAPGTTNFKSLPQAEQTQFEHAAVSEIEASVESFTTLSPYAGLFFDRVAQKRIQGGLEMAGRSVPRFQTTGCTTFSGDNSDPDQDGVPNADTVTYACASTSNGTAIADTGFFAYGDPSPNTADVDISDAANFKFEETGTSGNATLSFGGSSSISEGPGVLNLTGNWTLNDVASNSAAGDNGTFDLTAQETASYTFSGGALTSFGTLPPGMFSVAGSWSYKVQTTNVNVNLAFTVSTPTALSINTSACTANVEGIQSGEVDIKFSDGTLVKALWSGCPATPSITVT